MQHYVKPLLRQKVNELSFAYISNDLHMIECFVDHSLGFEKVSIGNRGFKLFDEVDPGQLKGLSLELVQCRQSDKDNLRTLVKLLKKTSCVSIDRLEVCWPVLKIIVENPLEFKNILGLHIEFDPRYHSLINQIAEHYAPKIKYFSMTEAIVKYPSPSAYLKVLAEILQRCRKLETL